MTIDFKYFRELALSFDNTNEQPHFEKSSFRIGKKIFATYDEKSNSACLKFSEIDQSVFSDLNKDIIYPVQNKWGKQGWTFVDLTRVSKENLEDALSTAYFHVAGTPKL